MPLPQLTPEYALRFNYYHHSNPMTGPRGRKLWEKIVLRPLLSDLFLSDKEQWELLNPNRATGPSAIAGVAVQKAVDSVLNIDGSEPMKLDEAVSWAKSEGLFFQSRYFLGENVGEQDEMLVEVYKTLIGDVIKNSVEGLEKAMARENKYIGEITLEDKLPGCELPHQTRPDYARRGDLKTKWSSLKKSSFVPKNLSGMFEKSWLYQIAGFWALNGQQPPFLVCANHKEYRIFDQDNSPELSDENLDRIVQQMSRHHQTTEHLLKKADNQEDLFRSLDPEWDHMFAWNLQPELIELAKRSFK